MYPSASNTNRAASIRKPITNATNFGVEMTFFPVKGNAISYFEILSLVVVGVSSNRAYDSQS
jgi:hypothetical protein